MERTENEKKKEYLRKYQDSVKTQKALIEEIRQLRIDTMMPSANTDGMPHGTGTSDLSSYAAKKDELIRRLNREMKRKLEIQIDITHRIDNMKNETEALVLRLRYIHGMKWEEIAVKMGYEYRNILYIHGKALTHFVLPENFA